MTPNQSSPSAEDRFRSPHAHRSHPAPDPQTKEAVGEALSGDTQILLLAPTGRDGVLTAQALRATSLPMTLCIGLSALCDQITNDTATILLTTEALDPQGMEKLVDVLDQQPPWSDLPVIVIATKTQMSALASIADALGNATVLERPLSHSSLLSAVKTAVRARQRQHQVRDLLGEAERARQAAEAQQREIAELNERLQRSMMETHHRVKNNLQIITAMIDMQVMEDMATVPISEMKRLSTHVRVLAAVHDMLTQQARVDAQNNFLSAKRILDQLLPMMQATAGDRRIAYRTEDATLTVRQGTSLALVVNELVNNALKHGLATVEVTMECCDGRLQLEICDDGPGFPPDFDPVKAAHTGLELVENLTSWDLAGTSRYENREQGGARVIISLPVAA